MTILKHGIHHSTPPFVGPCGQCAECGCVVEVTPQECQNIGDLENPFVKCPECDNDYLWVSRDTVEEKKKEDEMKRQRLAAGSHSE